MEYEVLGSLPRAERQQFLGQCPAQHFETGAAIVREGERGDAFYLIESGRVAFRTTNSDGDTNTLSVLGAGQAFGEMALVGRGLRTATAVALEPVTTRTMSGPLFETLRQRSPALDRLLIDILASRVDRLSQELSEALYLPVDVRLARRLLALCGVYRDGTGPTALTLTQDDIAGIVGARRPTVNQLLKQFAADGLLELGRGRIVVIDESRLRVRAAAKTTHA